MEDEHSEFTITAMCNRTLRNSCPAHDKRERSKGREPQHAARAAEPKGSGDERRLGAAADAQQGGGRAVLAQEPR
eukprot:scaffold7836_cov41-Prasinocladus_malaysianus.AAC.1